MLRKLSSTRPPKLMVAKVIFSSKKLSLRKINFIAPAMLNVTSYLGICNEAKLVSYLITTKKMIWARLCNSWARGSAVVQGAGCCEAPDWWDDRIKRPSSSILYLHFLRSFLSGEFVPHSKCVLYVLRFFLSLTHFVITQQKRCYSPPSFPVSPTIYVLTSQPSSALVNTTVLKGCVQLEYSAMKACR